MFQSDDFDDNISDESFSIIDKDILKTVSQVEINSNNSSQQFSKDIILQENVNAKRISPTGVTKLIENHDKSPLLHENPNRTKRKRKFPGPAGLLPDTSHETSHIVLGNTIQSSQSFCSSQNQLPFSVFEEAPWHGMKQDMLDLKSSNYSSTICDMDLCTIAFVKKQAGSYRLAGRRVPILAGVIQSIDRSLQDPLIVLRDKTADIQCTLHRDAWESSKYYLVPQYTVMLLQNTTVLTTGTAVKKNYLNITLNNVVAVYCDGNSSYAESNKMLKTDTEFGLNGKYSIESRQVNGETITILRNTSIKLGQNTILKGAAFPKEILNTTEAEKTKSIAESIFEGMNTDALFDDFD